MNMFLLLMSLYLLGSARGTSGQSDESSGSIDHQTSVQQLSGDEHASGEPAATGHAEGEHTVGEQPSGEQPSGEHLSSEQPLGEHASGEQPSDEQLSGEHASGEQPSGEHASGEQPSGEQPSGEQPSGAPISSISTGTILNCYTCAYMNDQGRCLRGEGTCITQNSQQCMLKKIFEGGKLQFMVQGCENMCPSMNLFSHGTRMQIICCRNQSFCNKI
ncbi:PREDICTED: acrosomal protein SP-10 isoform X5 [Mandrillus leucophaeus]|uniref:acrosomal protein SP-10 isoform X5 n=1 Tax=Mandrillus leucophaeus TaxID=9568 RepID=UPI0005F4DF05|nr:PREDICTED: acrosomal protein SP-10 isoform X5 [Mandrillus leucophaeus]